MVMTLVLSLMLIQGRGAPPPRRTAAQPPPSSRLTALFARLGIDLKIYSRLAGVRGARPMVGTSLLALDLTTGRERILAEAEHLWSPVSSPDGRILFATDSGIYAVQWAAGSTGPASTRISVATPSVVFGPTAADATILLTADEFGTGSACRVHLTSVHLGSTDPPQALEADGVPCSSDDSSWARTALRVSGDRLVSVSDGNQPLLLIGTAGQAVNFRDVGNTPIPIVNPIPGITRRMDPVWAGSATVVYVASR